MDEKINEASGEIKKYFDNLPLIDEKDIKDFNFFESCLYLEKLNLLDSLTSREGEDNE
jgi:hypothetical protein